MRTISPWIQNMNYCSVISVLLYSCLFALFLAFPGCFQLFYVGKELPVGSVWTLLWYWHKCVVLLWRCLHPGGFFLSLFNVNANISFFMSFSQIAQSRRTDGGNHRGIADFVHIGIPAEWTAVLWWVLSRMDSGPLVGSQQNGQRSGSQLDSGPLVGSQQNGQRSSGGFSAEWTAVLWWVLSRMDSGPLVGSQQNGQRSSGGFSAEWTAVLWWVLSRMDSGPLLGSQQNGQRSSAGFSAEWTAVLWWVLNVLPLIHLFYSIVKM